MNRLPISVILPTLNCRDKLERHLDASQEWLPMVEQIIAIDSNSTDGTLEVLQTRLARYNAEIICAEKGLYKCWNKAVQSAEQPYVYFSTIGDLIDFEGLRKLYSLATDLQAEIVISSPKMVDEKNMLIKRKWPIHYINDYLQSAGGTIIPDSQHLWTLATGFIPESIIGSSASNLYSSRTLKLKPFPEDKGHPADVYWAMQYLPSLKVCITSLELALFCFDETRLNSWSELHMIMNDMRQKIIELGALHDEKEIKPSIEDVIINFQNEAKQDLLKQCSHLEEYATFLKLNESQPMLSLKNKILMLTSVRYWIERYLNSRNRVNNQ